MVETPSALRPDSERGFLTVSGGRCGAASRREAQQLPRPAHGGCQLFIGCAISRSMDAWVQIHTVFNVRPAILVGGFAAVLRLSLLSALVDLPTCHGADPVLSPGAFMPLPIE